MKEYAIYKGEELLAIGTAQECAEELGVTDKYIYWLATPTAKRIAEGRKNPHEATTAVRI